MRVSAGISNLLEGQMYHSRLVVSNAAGVAMGTDQRFSPGNKVAAWGSDADPGSTAPAAVPIGLSNVVAVAAGQFHSLALRTDRTVVAWGWTSTAALMPE